jgi:hypothetical protein
MCSASIEGTGFPARFWGRTGTNWNTLSGVAGAVFVIFLLCSGA